MGRARAIRLFPVLVLVLFFVIAAEANTQEYGYMLILMDEWNIKPPSWVSADPCDGWEGIKCTNSRITALALANMGLKGQLPTDIELLSELEILNLSFNEGLTGQLRASIGNLKKLVHLNLVGCSFFGPIPDAIGSLTRLSYLSLKNNSFSGPIPPSIGNLSSLTFIDLSDNKLQGSIPVSNGSTLGLDKLLKARHFHFGNNQLSGPIPPGLFSSDMRMIHLIFDRNNLSGSIPSTVGLVQTLLAIRLDENSLTGAVPTSLNNLTNVAELHLANNMLTGPIPNLTGMNLLSYVDLSNNTFAVSNVPTWFSTLKLLTTLMMENTGLQGDIPQALFSFGNLEKVVLRNNLLTGLLDITNSSSDLQLIDMERNFITELTQNKDGFNYTLILVNNPICEGSQNINYCIVTPSIVPNSMSPTLSNCTPVACPSGQVSSPNCKCAYPYRGTLVFIFVSFSNLGNYSYYRYLEKAINDSCQSFNLPVDSVSLGRPAWGSSFHLELVIEIFPSGDQVRFNQTGVSAISSLLSNQTLDGRPRFYGPYSLFFPSSSSGGGSVLLLLIVLVGGYALYQKRRADSPSRRSILMTAVPGAPELKGARLFSFEELKKYTDDFSEANDIGSGGYGQVYCATLPTGQMVAIKRARRESMQGAPEFKAEVELLSRVHHKNLVSLVGFCMEQGEQMLVYEYVPNGDLLNSLSGKSRIKLDWMRRLKVALGAAKGLAYLHEHANPTIIHRDIKSNNILLDKDLEAKVADFGLCKSMADTGKDYITTQVKGTMGYMDPEYYMTQQLTEKSDVYSFGVVLLELITAKRPIERGHYIVRVVQSAMDKSKDFYNLHEVLDPEMDIGNDQQKSVQMFVDLAMLCVDELRAKRPRMGTVVKELENIIQISAPKWNDNANSVATSASYEDSGEVSKDLYSVVFDYSTVLEGRR
ncbi:leucine-rich repeat receptor protein kinase HPCA1-like isoform X2 [Argentina anserina]|uniref:leucine-rich repeat receptor protein kinase HPCA1-like isoform X2 n=1 Tax=Argentina anserina TaxID=57926 RepID=UPI0021762E31|nr:leucine-rich repeat receptor protein kinase HPCA1-like isoform X2 [Potentilla anserina]